MNWWSMGFNAPDFGLNFFSASRSSDRARRYRWSNARRVAGRRYGKAEAGTFQAADAVNSATVLAIRDAGARIAIELPRQSFRPG